MGQSVATAMESSVDHPFVSDVDSSVDPTSEADPFMYLTVGAGPSAAYADERGDGSSVDSPSTPTDARAPLVNFAEKQDEQELAVEGRGAELDDVPASAHTLPVDQGQRSPFSAPRVASSAGEASQTLVFQSPKVTGDADQFVSHSPETMTSEKGFFASDTRSFQSQSLEASTEDNSFARDTQQHYFLSTEATSEDTQLSSDAHPFFSKSPEALGKGSGPAMETDSFVSQWTEGLAKDASPVYRTEGNPSSDGTHSFPSYTAEDTSSAFGLEGNPLPDKTHSFPSYATGDEAAAPAAPAVFTPPESYMEESSQADAAPSPTSTQHERQQLLQHSHALDEAHSDVVKVTKSEHDDVIDSEDTYTTHADPNDVELTESEQKYLEGKNIDTDVTRPGPDEASVGAFSHLTSESLDNRPPVRAQVTIVGQSESDVVTDTDSADIENVAQIVGDTETADILDNVAHIVEREVTTTSGKPVKSSFPDNAVPNVDENSERVMTSASDDTGMYMSVSDLEFDVTDPQSASDNDPRSVSDMMTSSATDISSGTMSPTGDFVVEELPEEGYDAASPIHISSPSLDIPFSQRSLEQGLRFVEGAGEEALLEGGETPETPKFEYSSVFPPGPCTDQTVPEWSTDNTHADTCTHTDAQSVGTTGGFEDVSKPDWTTQDRTPQGESQQDWTTQGGSQQDWTTQGGSQQDWTPQAGSQQDWTPEGWITQDPQVSSLVATEDEAVEEDKEATATEEDKEMTTVEEDKEATAVEEDKEATAVEEDKEETYVEEDQEVTSVVEDKEVTTVEEDHEMTAVEEDKEITTCEEDQEMTAVEDGSQSPAQDGESEQPRRRSSSRWVSLSTVSGSTPTSTTSTRRAS